MSVDDAKCLKLFSYNLLANSRSKIDPVNTFFSRQISDPEKCDQMYESLARINSNVYRQRVSIFTYLVL